MKATKKPETPPHGGPEQTDAFHALTSIRGDPSEGGSVVVIVSSWISEADHDAGKTAYTTRPYTVTMDYAPPNKNKNLRDFLWAAIKADAAHDSFFTDATDVAD